MKKYMLGIDIGTQSIRTYLYDAEAKCIGKASVSQYMDTPRPGWATQKPIFWWASVVNNIKKLLAETKIDSKDIMSVGSCAVMHSPVPVSRDMQVLQEDVQLYCDKRAAEIADDLSEKQNISEIFELSANMPTSNWFGIKIKWIQSNMPDIYEKTYKFLTPKDFINYMLTSEPCIDHSEASGSFMMDRNTDEWSNALIDNLGIEKEKLPRIVKSSGVIGKVTRKAAVETGLAEGTVVVAGGGDMLCSLLTSGLTARGSVVDLTGTGSLITFYDDKPFMDNRIMNLRHVIPGWVPFGCIDSSGGAFRWFRDVLGKKEAETARNAGLDEYDYLCGLAAETRYGAEGLMFFPYLMGERSLGTANSRALFFGMNQGTETGHFVRAILEGIAFEHKRTLDILEGSGTRIEAVYHTGGGAKGQLWSQIKADIYGKPVCTLKVTEGGVLGAALLGGVGARLLESETEAAKMVTEIDREFMPDKTKSQRYEYFYKMFCDIHDLLQKQFHRLAEMP
jgi:xylulokinase